MFVGFLHLLYCYSLLDLGIEVRSILTPIGQGSSQVSGSSQLSSKDVFLSKTEVKNISQINASSEVMFLFICSFSL